MVTIFGPRPCVRRVQMRSISSSRRSIGTTAVTIERLSRQAAITVTTEAVPMKSRPRTQRGRNCSVATPTQPGNVHET